MSSYNIIRYEMTCPRCGQRSEMELFVEFGVRNFLEYKIGDVVQWVPGKAEQNGGRPISGSLMVDSYGVCSKCDRDFFVPVVVTEDILASVDTGHARAGYDAEPREE